MIVVKGFYSVPKFFNNQPNSVAVFGELTQIAATYARDFKTYTNETSQLSFCLFSCKDGVSPVDLTPTYSTQGCDVGDWIYSVAPNISINLTPIEWAQLMQAALGNGINTVTCGELITDGTRVMPRWVSWQVNAPNDTYFFKVWLSSHDFQESYDDFEIYIVPPVDNVDKLFQAHADLVTELARNNIAVIHERMMEVKNNFPETVVRTEMIEIIDRTNTNNRVQSAWTALVYGRQGDNTDSIRNAIRAYNTSHSTNTEADWRVLMPDLFNVTCFYVYPLWTKFAVAPRLSMPGINSPVVSAWANLEYVRLISNAHMTEAHVREHLETTSHRYKNLSLNFIGGTDNRLGKCKFSDYFPDYINEASTSEDFFRQSTATKDITNLMTVMLKKIDLWEQDSTLPPSIRVFVKHGMTFLASKYDNIEYYVLMKPTHQ